jgi:hypothetical protein
VPTSNPYAISKIMHIVMTIDPYSVLDIGAGFGKYGLLCREYLELWDGRGRYSEFLRRIDAVEVFRNYITAVHRFVYNNIYVHDVSTLMDDLRYYYDLVLLIGTLEHFYKIEGELLLKKILSNNEGLIVCTPKKVRPQGRCFNNIYETHRSQWTEAELTSVGNSFFMYDRRSIIAYIGANECVNKLKKSMNYFLPYYRH